MRSRGHFPMLIFRPLRHAQNPNLMFLLHLNTTLQFNVAYIVLASREHRKYFGFRTLVLESMVNAF